jgi:trans-aconitate 2-methyltransferase
MAVDWNPTQYERFKRERAQPFWDLAALVDAGEPLRRCVDLGCGTGELTAAAARQWGCERMLGIDSSPNMLREAQAFASDSVRFELGDISGWTSAGDHDLVFANAALQWIGDHPSVLRAWAAGVRPGGQLAVQVPSNSHHQSHLAGVAVAHAEPFLSAFGGEPPTDPVAANVLRPEQYAELLFELGFSEQHVRLQVYPHPLASSGDVVEWVKGTFLTRFLTRLPSELHEPFLAAYRTELLRRIGDVSPYLYLFNRVLMWGRLG